MEQNNQNNQQNPNTSNNNNAPRPQQQQQPQPQQQPQQQQQQQQQKPPQQNNPPKQAVSAAAAAQSKKNLIISGIVILAVLVLLILIPRLKNDAPATPEASEPVTEETENGNGSVAGENNSSSAPLSRTAALAAYQGKMITITGNCEVSPEDQTQTKGTTILINNDTTTAHTITVGPKSYRVSGLHYTLSWLNLEPGTLAITCDGETSDSTIVVQ